MVKWITAYAEIGTAIGTIGAVIVALFIAGADSRRRRAQEGRTQAELISGWMIDIPQPPIVGGELQVNLVLQNGSQQLAYWLIATIVNASSNECLPRYRTFVGRLPPGQTVYQINHPGHGMHKRFSVELAFQDAKGQRWVRRGNGVLQKLSAEPLAYYGIDPPVGWLMP